MSLSRRKKIRIKPEALVPCPECGALALAIVRKDLRLPDGLFVADLERYQCATCGADFFPPSAMKQIEAVADLKKQSRKIA